MSAEKKTPDTRYAIVAAVQLPNVTDIEFEASLTELRELAKTLGYKVIHTFIQKRTGFDRTAYLGVGKREEMRHYVNGGADDAGSLSDTDTDGGRGGSGIGRVRKRGQRHPPSSLPANRSTSSSSTMKSRRCRRATWRRRSAAR
jgi:hypothetical protein